MCTRKFFNKNFFARLFVIVLLFCLSVSDAHAAGVPTILSFQGRLADSSGNLIGSSAGTTYYFKFSIWDLATGGSSPDRLWPAGTIGIATSSVRQGVFNVNIGDTDAGYPDILNYNFNTNKNIYLQIEVSSTIGGTYEALSPRQRISATPFAQVAGAVSGAGQSSFGTTTPASNAIVTIEATTSSSVGALIRAAMGQVADLFKIQDSSGNHLFSIDSTGGIFGSSTLTIGSSTATSFIVNSGGNVGVGTAMPGSKFDVFDVNSTPQLRLSQSISAYSEFQVDYLGNLWLSSAGKNITQGDGNLWVCSGGHCDPSVTPAGQGNIVVENSVTFDNKFRIQQVDASTTIMYDKTDQPILEFDEGQ